MWDLATTLCIICPIAIQLSVELQLSEPRLSKHLIIQNATSIVHEFTCTWTCTVLYFTVGWDVTTVTIVVFYMLRCVACYIFSYLDIFLIYTNNFFEWLTPKGLNNHSPNVLFMYYAEAVVVCIILNMVHLLESTFTQLYPLILSRERCYVNWLKCSFHTHHALCNSYKLLL